MSWTTFPVWRKLARRSNRCPVGKHQGLMPYLQKSTKQANLSCCKNSHSSFSQSGIRVKFHSISKTPPLFTSTSERATGNHVTITEVSPFSPSLVRFWLVCYLIASYSILNKIPLYFQKVSVASGQVEEHWT